MAKFNLYQTITDRIIEALKGGDIPWQRPWRSTAPVNIISKKPYRGINPFLLQAMPYGSPYWMTFNQARNLGGHVNKGEKATMVVFWKMGTYDAQDADGETETRNSFLLRFYHVFNAEQTTLASACKQMEKEEPVATPTCEDLVQGFIGCPEIKQRNMDRACYSPVTDIVTMPKMAAFHESTGYYATLFHELVHSTGHAKRLDRDIKNTFGSELYAKEELIAEIGSAFLCGTAQIAKPALEQNTVAYIQSWIKALQNDPKMIVSAAAAAQSAVDLITGAKAKKESQMAEEPEAIAA